MMRTNRVGVRDELALGYLGLPPAGYSRLERPAPYVIQHRINFPQFVSPFRGAFPQTLGWCCLSYVNTITYGLAHEGTIGTPRAQVQCGTGNKTGWTQH